jgi:hypothetical protein
MKNEKEMFEELKKKLEIHPLEDMTFPLKNSLLFGKVLLGKRRLKSFSTNTRMEKAFICSAKRLRGRLAQNGKLSPFQWSSKR